MGLVCIKHKDMCGLFVFWTDQLLESSQPNATSYVCQNKSQTPKERQKQNKKTMNHEYEGQTWYTSIKWGHQYCRVTLLNKVKVPCREDSNYIPTKHIIIMKERYFFLLFGFLVLNSAVQYMTNRRRYLIGRCQSTVVLHLRNNKHEIEFLFYSFVLLVFLSTLRLKE